MTNESTYGSQPQRLAELLAACAGSTTHRRVPRKDQAAEEILAEMLGQEVVLDADIPDSLRAVLGRSCDEMLATAGHSVIDLLLDRGTDLTVLKCLKDYAKALVRRADGEHERAAATALYYAAIAAALLFHRHKITLLPYNRLDGSFSAMEEKPWIPSEIKDLFRLARDACRRETRSAL